MDNRDFKKEHQDGLERDNPFRAALLKAGVVDSKKIQQVKDEEKKAADAAQAHQDWLEEEEAKKRRAASAKRDEDAIPDELKETFKKLQKLWVEKPNFVKHLIYSYIPLIHTPFMFEAVKEEGHKCAITHVPLLKTDDIIQKGFFDKIQTQLLLEKNKDILDESEQKEIIDAYNRKMNKMHEKGTMGLKAPESDAYLSAHAVKCLKLFVSLKMFDRDFEGVGHRLGKIVMPMLGALRR